MAVIKLSYRKKVFIVAAVLLAVFLVLDYGYFWANLQFILYPPKISSQPADATTSQPTAKQAPDILTIESLGITAPIIYISEKSEKAYQAALINGIVHFPGTANPGQPGNVYIFGHSSDFFWSKGHYKSVFAVLTRIKKGAPILITDSLGNQFTYLVTNSFVVGPSDASVLDQQGYKKKLLTLQTSWPVGTALKRFIVTAEIKNP